MLSNQNKPQSKLTQSFKQISWWQWSFFGIIFLRLSILVKPMTFGI